jgi:fido (protein-threonine AMPylation protein)
VAVTAVDRPPRFTRSPHLVDLVAETERLAARIVTAPADDRAALLPDLHAGSVIASLQLDGSRLTEVPDVRVTDDLDALAAAVAAGDHEGADHRAGSWFAALRALDEPPDEQLLALEYLGGLAGLTADDLADRVLADTVPALEELHRRLTRGLVAPDRAGQPRQVDQAIHDGATGRIIMLLPDPALIPGELGMLGAWVGSAGTREHALIVSGVLHLEVLRIHPFDAANGRLARAAARLVLRSRGLDPDGAAAFEPALARDPLGYHEEVARTHRRRDLTIWLERWGEAVTDGLRATAQRLGVLDPEPPERAVAFVTSRTSPAFTVADYRADAGAPPEEARAELAALLDAGRVTRVPGTRGLRFLVAGPSPS